MPQPRQRFVLFIPDGAADLHRAGELSPLAAAATANCDFVARHGISGRMATLYDGLPRESMVAQLGILGWDPFLYYPHGRSSCELLALRDSYLEDEDLAFRANLVRMDGSTLASYSAGFIESAAARPLVERVDGELRRKFPDFELYHNSDFRNTLVVRGAGLDPATLLCPEPHEHQGEEFELGALIHGIGQAPRALAGRINRYLLAAAALLRGEAANALFPWSASRAFRLPAFAAVSGFSGRVAVVGFMDFLMGIAKAGDVDFFRLGNGRPDTDYRGKGEKVVELLDRGYEFVVCHVNAPDEASHLGDRELKIRCIEAFDREVVGPAVRYFRRHPEALGGVMIAPDHYTNHAPEAGPGRRAEAHSLDPVPFCLWNGRDRDAVTAFGEEQAAHGALGGAALNHLDLLRLLGVGPPAARAATRAATAG